MIRVRVVAGDTQNLFCKAEQRRTGVRALQGRLKTGGCRALGWWVTLIRRGLHGFAGFGHQHGSENMGMPE